MFTDKLGGIELPYSHNIKIDENHKLFAIYAIPENTVTLKCEINLISRNQVDFAKSDLTEMRNQTKFIF